MPTLYLIEQNTYLRKRGDRLLLCRRPQTISKRSRPARVDEIILDLPCADVDHIMLFGNIQVTAQALKQLLRHGIELAIFSYSGKLLGQLTPPKTKNIPLRLAQYALHQDEEFKLDVARAVVEAKLDNALEMARQHRKNNPHSLVQQEIDEMAAFCHRARQVNDLGMLRGIEGAGTAKYFQLFSKMIMPPWRFTGRTRRPPRDPCNAVLSYGYVVVGAELQALLDGVGFDPYLGFYHTVDYGRPSLALDLLEEFRHPLVDRLALNLFNRNILTEQDFRRPPKGGCYLATEGKRKFFIQYEKMLGELATSSGLAESKHGFRTIFRQQVEKMQKAVLDKQPYEPFRGYRA